MTSTPPDPKVDEECPPEEQGEECQAEEKVAQIKEEEAGMDEEFSDWSGSKKAYFNAIFHTILYFIIGVVFFSYILDTKWTIIESIYFSVVIFTTVGYGDVSANNTVGGEVFTMFFALYGIIILGVFLGILGEEWTEGQKRISDSIAKKTSDDYLTTLLAPDATEEGSDSLIDATEDKDANTKKSKSLLYDICQILKHHWISVVLLVVLGIPILLLENWGISSGIYWLVITGTTIGLGDVHPVNRWSKLICIFYIPFTVVLTGAFLGSVMGIYVGRRNDALEDKFLSRALCESALEKMDTNKDDKVTKDEFLIYMLKTLDMAEQEDIEKILSLFEKLDKDGSGNLSKEDIGFIPTRTEKLRNDRIKNHTTKKPRIGGR